MAFKIGQLKLARYAFEQCLIQTPHHGYAICNLAMILYCLGDEETCLSLIEAKLDESRQWKEMLYLKYHLLKNVEDYEKKKVHRFYELEENMRERNDDTHRTNGFIHQLDSKRVAYMEEGAKMTSIHPITPFEVRLANSGWEGLGTVILEIFEKVKNGELMNITPLHIITDDYLGMSQENNDMTDQLDGSMLHEANPLTSDVKTKSQDAIETSDKELRRKKMVTLEPSNTIRASRRVKEKQEEEKAKSEDHIDFKQALDRLIPGGALMLIDSVEEYRAGKFEDAFRELLQVHPVKRPTRTKLSRFIANASLTDVFQASIQDKLKISETSYLEDHSMQGFLEHLITNSGIRDVAYRFLNHVCLANYCWPSLSFFYMILNMIHHFMVVGDLPATGHEHRPLCDLDLENFSLILSWSEIILDYANLDKKYHLKWFDPIDLSRLLDIKNNLQQMCARSLGTLLLSDSIKWRLFWFSARIELYEGNLEKSLEILHDLLRFIETGTAPSPIILTHCIEEFSIDSTNVHAKILEIQNEHYIYDAKRLFEQGEHVEVIGRLRPVLPRLDLTCKNASFWRAYELHILFIDSLVQTENYEEASRTLSDLLTSLMRNLPCREWKRIYEAIECSLEKFLLINSSSLLVISSLHEDLARFNRLLANIVMLTQITQILMEHEDTDFQANFSLPWIALFDILKSLYTTQNRNIEEYGLSYHEDLHELLARAHYELGKRFRCTRDNGRLLKLCIEVFSTMTDEDSVSERNQCYYCLYGLNLDVSLCVPPHGGGFS